MSTSRCSTEPRAARHGRTGDAFRGPPQLHAPFFVWALPSPPPVSQDAIERAHHQRGTWEQVFRLSGLWRISCPSQKVGRVGVCQGSSQGKGTTLCPSHISPQLLQKSTDLILLESSDNRADAVGSPGGWRAGGRRNPSCWGVGLCRMMSLPISSAGGRSPGETFTVQYHLPNAASTSSEAASNGGFFCFCELFLGLAAPVCFRGAPIAHRPNGEDGTKGGWENTHDPLGDHELGSPNS